MRSSWKQQCACLGRLRCHLVRRTEPSFVYGTSTEGKRKMPMMTSYSPVYGASTEGKRKTPMMTGCGTPLYGPFRHEPCLWVGGRRLSKGLWPPGWKCLVHAQSALGGGRIAYRWVMVSNYKPLGQQAAGGPLCEGIMQSIRGVNRV